MKFTAMLMLAFCFQVNAKGFSQNVTLSLRNVPLQKVFKEITRQTGYNFIYTTELLRQAGNISVEVSNAPLENVLQDCLGGSSLTYVLIDKTIIIREKQTEAVAATALPPAAEDFPVKGKVTDQDSKPLQGVSVILKGSDKGVTTDGGGNFTIDVPENSSRILTISYVGMEPKEINVSGRTAVSVALVPAVSQQQVVVIGYGTVNKKDVTGAVSTVAAKNFNKGVITSPDQLLQNKVPGVEITNTSGQPGAATTVKIRGNSSIRAGNDPLYVIDGVPLDGRSARPTLSSIGIGTTPESNPLMFINPNDIAQIDVLKDASSAAIYGSRGSNGIIAITTKTETAGPLKVEFGAGVGLNAGLMKRFDVLDASEFRSALKKYNITGYDSGYSVDPFKAIANKNLSQNYTLSFGGGNENGAFRASFLGSSTQGYISTSSLDKYIGNFSGHYSLMDKKLKLEFSVISGHTTENIAPVTNNAGAEGSLLGSVIQWNPTMRFQDDNGLFIYPGSNTGNPLAWLAAYHDKALVNTVLGHISASFQIAKGLEYKFLYAINNSVGNRLESIDGFLVGPKAVQSQGVASILNAKLTSQTFTHTVSYKTNLAKSFSLTALAGFEHWSSNYSNYSMSARKFNTNLQQNNIVGLYTDYIQNAAVITTPVSSVEPETKIQSYFVRALLNYQSRYYLTATFRADGSSKFGANNKYGYFPAVAAKWVLTGENFMRDNRLFANLAIRASWGITGNQEFPAGSSLEQYSIQGYNQIRQSNLYNSNLKWEQTQSTDIGLDFTSRSNRVWGSVDYFRKNTTNILFQAIAVQPGPASYGFINLPGHIMNNGVELGLGASLVESKNFSWEVNGNFTSVKNVMRKFQQNGMDISQPTSPLQGPFAGSPMVQRIANNQPVDVFYLQKFEGFDAKGITVLSDSFYYAGNPNPTMLFGFSTTLRYKNFTLDINMGGAVGYVIYNCTANAMANIGWINGGQNIDRKTFHSTESPADGVLQASDRYLESGNYLKMRNVSLSYRFGDVGKYFKQVTAYVSGSNLFVITKFSGYDPEVNVDESSQGFPSRSIEFLPYPTARSFQAGINFSL